MRDALDRLLRDLTLVTIAIAIALGWSLIQVAEGVAETVLALAYELGAEERSGFVFPFSRFTGVLAWDVGGHVLTIGALVAGLVQLGVVLVVAAFIHRRFRNGSADEERFVKPS